MMYLYCIAYDSLMDDFYGVVEVNISGKMASLFSIEDTDEICDLIDTGVMKHIDDVEGLRKHLVNQHFLDKDDVLLLQHNTRQK